MIVGCKEHSLDSNLSSKLSGTFIPWEWLKVTYNIFVPYVLQWISYLFCIVSLPFPLILSGFLSLFHSFSCSFFYSFFYCFFYTLYFLLFFLLYFLLFFLLFFLLPFLLYFLLYFLLLLLLFFLRSPILSHILLLLFRVTSVLLSLQVEWSSSGRGESNNSNTDISGTGTDSGIDSILSTVTTSYVNPWDLTIIPSLWLHFISNNEKGERVGDSFQCLEIWRKCASERLWEIRVPDFWT